MILPGSTTKNTLLMCCLLLAVRPGEAFPKIAYVRVETTQALHVTDHEIMRGLPKIRGTILEVPRIRTVVCCGSIWGPPVQGNCHEMKLLLF